MSTSYSSNLRLGTPALADTGWKTVLDANRAILDSLSPIAGIYVLSKESPSTTLNVKVTAGSFRAPDGSVVDFPGSSSFAIDAWSTRYVWLTPTGTLTKGAAWPATPHVRLAVVTTNGTTVTSVTDARVALACAGTATGLTIVQTYSTTATTLGAYTADPETSAYTGAADSEAKLADLNALRVAVENLRALAEDTAKVLNALIDALQARGDIG